MSIRDWPEDERPREKLLKHGPAALSEAELIAIFLRTGLPGRSALDVARALLVTFRSLRGLLTADQAAVCATPGLGPARFAALQAVLELARRHAHELMQHGPVLSNPAGTREYLALRLRDLDYEVFCCLYLDSRNRVKACEELFRGTLDGAAVHPREVIKRALVHQAAAVILALGTYFICRKKGLPSPVLQPNGCFASFCAVSKCLLIELRLSPSREFRLSIVKMSMLS